MPTETWVLIVALAAIAAGLLLLEVLTLRAELAEAREDNDELVLKSGDIFEAGRREGVAQADAQWRAHPLYRMGYQAAETAAQAREGYKLETCRDVERGEGVE